MLDTMRTTTRKANGTDYRNLLIYATSSHTDRETGKDHETPP
jgi:hypothetical protein